MDLTALLLASLVNITTPQSEVGVYELPAIAGLWQLDDLSCQERYNFGRDGKLITTSGDERTTGEYRFGYGRDESLPVLAIRTRYDNGQADCMGNREDQSNNSFAVFVALNDRHNPTTMQWCDDEQGNHCGFRFSRVLP